MALAQTSDDSLRQILSFLTAQDVMCLMATGLKGFMARVGRNTTCLFWRFSRPTYFPSCSFTFASLRFLSIKSNEDYVHLSLHGRTILPLEPMASLESLVLDFPTSHLVFAPVTSNGGTTLSSLFPKLTSLTVHAQKKGHLPDDWPHSLPEGLLFLNIDINPIRGNATTITPSSFDHLPVGLQHLEFGFRCAIGAGEINFQRFPDLRVLKIMNTLTWNVLKTLPNSLEVLTVRCWDFGTPEETFSISKIPPKMRALTLNGRQLMLNFDAMAPPTIEELELSLGEDIEAHHLQNSFHTKNLRIVGELGHYEGSLTEQTLSMLPNVVELHRLGGIDSAFGTLETLPRKLESLVLRDSMIRSPSVSYQHLPPSLKQFNGPVLCAEHITELPKSITSLQIHRPQKSSITLSAAVWRELPSLLRRLDVQTCLFESEECFQALPDGIKELSLDLAPSDCTGHHITFSKALQESLEKLNIYFAASYMAYEDHALEYSFFPKLTAFSRLSSLRILLKIFVDHSTLSFLPKTLKELGLYSVQFVNFGLPVGQETATADWKEGALSRLPTGLEVFRIIHSKDATMPISFKVFSHLPQRLVSLNINTHMPICQNPKSFISSLPRRISDLKYIYNGQKHPGVDSDYKSPAERELEEAINEYYSDPFWDGLQYAICRG